MYNYNVSRKAIEPSRKSEVAMIKKEFESRLTFRIRKVNNYSRRPYTVTAIMFA